MAPKKKSRNNKTKKQQEGTPRPLPTIPCQRCSEDIIVPKTCRHGKKLINCQGTGCTTAHIAEHDAHCPAAVRPTLHFLAMHDLTLQVNALVKLRHGKAPRYVGGTPWTEWFGALERGSPAYVHMWTEELRGVVEGRKALEDIGYDDAESDDGDGCPTPDED